MSAPGLASSTGQATLLDRLVEELRARDLALEGQERPAAVLWTDPKREWRPLIEPLRQRMGELLTLGAYDPAARTGPAIWIRCLVDRVLAEPELPAERAPIVYLPGVARQDLRAGEECPEELRPLVELMYRGVLWVQNNGSDWGVATFLTSPRALWLDIGRDAATTDALLRALPEVAVTPLAQLTGRRLEADDFDRMLAGDVVRDLLRWIGDPAGTRARLGQNGWAAFCNRSREELDFDPEIETDVDAGVKLGRAEGAWEKVWERFVEAPGSYGDLIGVLRRSRPIDKIPFDQERERWPNLNDEEEERVQKALRELTSLAQPAACEAILELEKAHGERRGWVWTQLGASPMARLLKPLARVATAARSAIGGSTPDDVAQAYLERGWQADAGAWEAIALASTGAESLVRDVVRHLLRPWLEDSARAFQAAVGRSPLPGRNDQPHVEAGDDVCLVFADGLRYDLGQRLTERLEGSGCRVKIGRRWAALPTVTPTAKPAVTPVAGQISGSNLGEDFRPRIEKADKPASAQNLRAAIESLGYQILGEGSMDWPQSDQARGWLECGEIDALGHKLAGRLPRQIEEELERLADRISSLLKAGWRAVRVVTDHGWLLLPGGLPKVDLPKHLTASRWARCAVLAGGATPEVSRFPWHWNTSQSFATAPGIACFNKTEEYAHGGLSIQECLIPDIVVERGLEAASATIQSITWRGLRCFVEAKAVGGPVNADLRLARASGASVALASKPLGEDGSASLVLAGDEHEGAPLVLVLVDAENKILTQKRTKVGESS